MWKLTMLKFQKKTLKACLSSAKETRGMKPDTQHRIPGPLITANKHDETFDQPFNLAIISC